MLVLLWAFLGVLPLFGQGCTSVPTWSACDLAFDLTPEEDATSVRFSAEFRSPDHRTYLIPAFREGNRRFVLRFSPTQAGAWDYRIASSVARLDGQTGQVSATDSGRPGFVRVANVHHFATEDLKPHLWMSTAVEQFATLPRSEFDRLVDQRAQERFTHLRVTIDAGADLVEAAERVRAMNAKGLTADLVLAGIPAEPRERERSVTEMVARFAAFNITWAGIPAFEETPQGRALLKDAGALLRKLDAYGHPRTTMAASSSGPLVGDGWMNVLTYGTTDANIGSVEHQFYAFSAVNAGIQSQRDLWNATMNGHYPASGSGPFMKAWFDFMSASRYWELEPYFDVDGGRAIALDGVEYIVYLEKPGLVELTLEKHGYDVAWLNPATGQMTKGKEYNGQHFTGEPPDKSHDWVLRVSREGRKEGMLRSYKFDSRRVPVQEVEQNPEKVPFEISAPSETEISLSRPAVFALKIKRESRATRSLLAEWMGEVVLDGQGYRVVGTAREGTLRIPPSIASRFPAVFSLRLALLNANGKAYVLDKVFRLIP